MSPYDQQFVGVWSLLDWTVLHLETEAQSKYYDGREEGFIIYTPDGWVASSIHDLSRPQNTDDRTARLQLTDAIKSDGCARLSQEHYDILTPFALSALGYLGYCGPYEADGENVRHRVRSSGRPSLIGVELTRSYAFEGDTLRLIGEAHGYRDNLLWRRETSGEARQ